MSSETVEVVCPSFVFSDGRRKTIGDFFEEANFWGVKVWRSTPELRMTWARLSSLPWKTQGKPLRVRVEDLKILCGFLATADLGGPDVRLLVQQINALADCLPEEAKGPVLEDLDLTAEDSHPAPPLNGAAHTNEEETHG